MSKKIPVPPEVRKFFSACGKVGGKLGDRARKAEGGRYASALRAKREGWKTKVRPANEPDKPV